MRHATLVKSLNLEKVTMGDFEDMKHLQFLRIDDPKDGHFPVFEDEVMDYKITEHVVPIHRISKWIGDREITSGGRVDTFIAISPEVQTFLKMPFDVIAKELDESRADNRYLRSEIVSLESDRETLSLKFLDYANANWWNRLKFLFTGNLGSLR